MTHPRSRRGAALEALALAAVFFLSFALFYRLTLRPSSDISIHATWAAEGNFADLTSFLHHGAHPMWHVLVALVLRLGVPLAHAAALVTAACKTAGGVAHPPADGARPAGPVPGGADGTGAVRGHGVQPPYAL